MGPGPDVTADGSGECAAWPRPASLLVIDTMMTDFLVAQKKQELHISHNL